jgi:hypothetical protein
MNDREFARQFIAVSEEIYSTALERGDLDLAETVARNASEVSMQVPGLWDDGQEPDLP